MKHFGASKGSANNTEIQDSAEQTAACRNYVSDPLEFSVELALLY